MEGMGPNLSLDVLCLLQYNSFPPDFSDFLCLLDINLQRVSYMHISLENLPQ